MIVHLMSFVQSIKSKSVLYIACPAPVFSVTAHLDGFAKLYYKRELFDSIEINFRQVK